MLPAPNTKKIPQQNLYSIFLTGNQKRVLHLETLPFQIKRNIESLIHFHPSHTHKIYSDEELRCFINLRFGKEVIKAYDNLRPLAYKADLGRYCLLYENGGLYADLSVCFFSSLYDNGSHQFGQPIFFAITTVKRRG
jgi:hypothetical protein